jgi:FkbM family methyltransferase
MIPSGRDRDARYASLWPLIERALSLAGYPPTVFELGAADGVDTGRLFAAAMKANGAVPLYYAFEPDHRNFLRCRAAGLPPEVRLFASAVGATNGEVALHLSSGEHDGRMWERSSSIRQPKEHLARFPWVHFDRIDRVPIVTLDWFCLCQDVAAIDFLWMDLQGAERDVVAGGTRMLPRTKFIFMERESVEMFEGQWVGDEAILPGFGVSAAFPYDLLLYNQEIFGSDPLLSETAQQPPSGGGVGADESASAVVE